MLECIQPCHDAALLVHAAVCKPLPSLLQLSGVFVDQASVSPLLRHRQLLATNACCYVMTEAIGWRDSPARYKSQL